MRNFQVRTLVAVAVSALSLAACGDKADTSREVVLTPQAAPANPPPLTDTATPPTQSVAPVKSTPPRAKSTPRPATSAPPVVNPPVNPPANPPATSTTPVVTERYGTIPAGTDIAVKTDLRVCTNTQKVGDRVKATIADAVVGSDGAVIPGGANAELEVVESTPGINDSRKVRLALKLVSIEYGGHTYDLSGADVLSPPVQNVRRQSNTDQAKKVAVGAAVGAVVGKVVGKSTKATVGGAAVGAVGGAAAAVATADYDGCIGAETRLAVRLTQELKVRAA